MRRCLILLLPLFACLSDPDPKCATVEGSIPEKLTLSACTDNHERAVECSRVDAKDDWGCACMRDNEMGASFNWPAKMEPTDTKDLRELSAFLGRQCGWSLRLH